MLPLVPNLSSMLLPSPDHSRPFTCTGAACSTWGECWYCAYMPAKRAREDSGPVIGMEEEDAGKCRCDVDGVVDCRRNPEMSLA